MKRAVLLFLALAVLMGILSLMGKDAVETYECAICNKTVTQVPVTDYELKYRFDDMICDGCYELYLEYHKNID